MDGISTMLAPMEFGHGRLGLVNDWGGGREHFNNAVYVFSKNLSRME